MCSTIIDNYINFIQRHDEYFKHYDTFDDIPKSSLSGWLYIFIAKCYDENTSKVFDELVEKFGKTILTIFSRLDNYKVEVEPTNIECIHCTLPDERERLIKAFLKYKTSIRPVVGHEYFIGCRNLIKVLMLIMVYTSDNEIEIYAKYYAEKNIKEVEVFFNRIESIINKIREDDEFELQIEVDKYEEIVELEQQYICKFCKKEYKTLSSLNKHQKTAKFCLELQQKEEEDKKIPEIFSCEYCNKEFTIKYNFGVHVNSCKEKKIQESNNLNIRLKELEVENERLKKEVEEFKKEKEEFENFKKEKNNEVDKLKRERDKFEKENIELKMKLKFEQKNNTKLEKDINRLNRLIEKNIITINS